METIKDIVREMRGQGGDSGCPLDIKRYADRIEAAAKATVVTDNTETLHNLLDENARLKAAMKPVLEVNFSRVYGFDGYSVIPSRATSDVVLEAQRIYNEGAKR